MAKHKSPPARVASLSDSGLNDLALYNSEVARGLVHTPEWDKRMTVLQERFDRDIAQEAQWEAEAHTLRRRRQINLKK